MRLTEDEARILEDEARILEDEARILEDFARGNSTINKSENEAPKRYSSMASMASFRICSCEDSKDYLQYVFALIVKGYREPKESVNYKNLMNACGLLADLYIHDGKMHAVMAEVFGKRKTELLNQYLNESEPKDESFKPPALMLAAIVDQDARRLVDLIERLRVESHSETAGSSDDNGNAKSQPKGP